MMKSFGLNASPVISSTVVRNNESPGGNAVGSVILNVISVSCVGGWVEIAWVGCGVLGFNSDDRAHEVIKDVRVIIRRSCVKVE
jgi:hypothetical protein